MKELILPLEKQVCSLESAKRLKELGFPQESLFYWSDWCRHDSKEVSKVIQFRDRVPLLYKASYSYFWEEDLYSAYTVAELGELLPLKIVITRWYAKHEWRCVDKDDERGINTHVNGSQAEAMAKMLIEYAEKGLYERT